MISSHIDDINEDKRYKSYKEIEKEDHVFADYKVKCKCSHVVIMPYRHKKVLCDFCGCYIYRDKKDEFKDRLREKLKNEKEKD